MASPIIEGILSRDLKSISKAISVIERNDSESDKLFSLVFPHIKNRSHKIGITGPPGAGKSTLVNCLINRARTDGLSIATIGVDPSSPFTGGAILGDRIRMQDHVVDSDVFIRSMASRKNVGGVSDTTNKVGMVLDAAGYDMILFETVGVGQLETNIMEISDTVLVVLVPESGDSIQMMKAGLLEISDIFVVNKSDRPGSEKICTSLKNLIGDGASKDEWSPLVCMTEAIRAKGIDELFESIASHKKFLDKTESRHENDTRQYRKYIDELLIREFQETFWSKSRVDILSNELSKDHKNRKSPYDLFQILNSNEQG